VISDWRGDRRIGSPTLWERWADPLRVALTGIGVIAIVSAAIVAMKFWGHPVNWFAWSRLWCLLFGSQVAIVGIAGLIGPNKSRGLAFILAGAALFAAVWFLTLPILTALGVVMILPITPVNP